ncbi:MAG: type II toxin-antitoxin system VapC family toxin [Verrucomicrobiae bacterium]|nr:type II toxin-antitoxin system VapC family toxin [Verrucomicrobiae bacterium]
MIVADAALIACFTVRNERSALADAVCATDAVWAAPLLWRSEFRNVLAAYLRLGRLNLESALLALQAAEEVMAGREYRVASEPVLALAARSKCSALDCEYVVLAEDLGVPLVTPDRRILRAFPRTAVSLERFARKK